MQSNRIISGNPLKGRNIKQKKDKKTRISEVLTMLSFLWRFFCSR
ncbi:hypothetical protein M089_1668 [Bacteroides ovatus str. 3725 D9 iii]|nr:hypothetical protein M088_3042 [Bacteroides ovatus str. 3725 D1 iv]KDS18412.1 hypothetical protein M082_3420 [Bacteroides fragilis str. 3725 D9 ii]KDS44004.1 hypothetical protein M089_1668 [Bacteroides ovatus str. 3725 D9 iii]KXT41339.1 hypothetical protein HMPREF2532_04741 [Bacteroides ovatus]CAG9879842.1 hypothetical protein BOVA115_3869 [Bacteroides ovatus]